MIIASKYVLYHITHLQQQCHNSNSVIFFPGETFIKVVKCYECNDETAAVQLRVLQTASWHYTC